MTNINYKLQICWNIKKITLFLLHSSKELNGRTKSSRNLFIKKQFAFELKNRSAKEVQKRQEKVNDKLSAVDWNWLDWNFSFFDLFLKLLFFSLSPSSFRWKSFSLPLCYSLFILILLKGWWKLLCYLDIIGFLSMNLNCFEYLFALLFYIIFHIILFLLELKSKRTMQNGTW